MWKTIATDTTPDGHEVELRISESGKGRNKLRTWAMFRDGKKVGYASVERDVQPNWDRVRAGLVRNPETGRYEKPRPVEIADDCPKCGANLKSEGYPLRHQNDEGDECAYVPVPRETWDEHDND